MPCKTIVYLSGPMSGIEDWNFPAFDAAAKTLREIGYRVINPADFGAHERHTWSDRVARDLSLLPNAGLLVQLPGWESSEGAKLERDVALKFGLSIWSFESLLKLNKITLPSSASASEDPAPPAEAA